jgi:hypothetical protein
MAVSSRFSHNNDIGQPQYRPALTMALAQSGQELAKIKPFETAGAFSVPIESERRLYFFVLTRFLDANRYPPRIKSGAGFRSKTLCFFVLTRFLSANRYPLRSKTLCYGRRDKKSSTPAL